MEISSKTKKSTYFFTCTEGHLNSLFVPAVGNLPVCFQKMLMPGDRPGGGWALLEMTDALCARSINAFCSNRLSPEQRIRHHPTLLNTSLLHNVEKIDQTIQHLDSTSLKVVELNL